MRREAEGRLDPKADRVRLGIPEDFEALALAVMDTLPDEWETVYCEPAVIRDDHGTPIRYLGPEWGFIRTGADGKERFVLLVASFHAFDPPHAERVIRNINASFAEAEREAVPT